MRYSKKLYTEHMQSKVDLAEARCDAKKLHQAVEEEHAKVVQLEQRVEQMRDRDAELQRFNDQKPMIEHYLKVIPKLVE